MKNLKELEFLKHIRKNDLIFTASDLAVLTFFTLDERKKSFFQTAVMSCSMLSESWTPENISFSSFFNHEFDS